MRILPHLRILHLPYALGCNGLPVLRDTKLMYT